VAVRFRAGDLRDWRAPGGRSTSSSTGVAKHQLGKLLEDQIQLPAQGESGTHDLT
jgi:hypothetical protein